MNNFIQSIIDEIKKDIFLHLKYKQLKNGAI